MLNGAAISWLSKRQPTVALSSAEAEYITACLAAQEVQFIRQMLLELGLLNEQQPTLIYSDSQSAIHMAENPTSGRAKHIDIKVHFVKEARERGVAVFQYVHTTENAADALTKALTGPRTIHFRDIVTGETGSARARLRAEAGPTETALCMYDSEYDSGEETHGSPTQLTTQTPSQGSAPKTTGGHTFIQSAFTLCRPERDQAAAQELRRLAAETYEREWIIHAEDMGKHVFVAGWNINDPAFIKQSHTAIPQFPLGKHEDYQTLPGKPTTLQHPAAFGKLSMRHSDTMQGFLRKTEAMQYAERNAKKLRKLLRDPKPMKSLLTGKPFGPESNAVIDAAIEKHARRNDKGKDAHPRKQARRQETTKDDQDLTTSATT